MNRKGEGKEALKVFLLAFVLYTLTVLPVIIWHKGLFFYYGDYNVQQVPFYVLAHRLVHEGRFFWTFNLDLGGSLAGDMAFYLMGSPFFWITYPFPESVVPYLMPFLMSLKYATAACTAFLYIRRHVNTVHAARIGALLYAFSGFNACNIVFNHFTDVVAFFPLLLLTFDNLVLRDKGVDDEPAPIHEGYGDWLKFTFMVTLVSVINYYFFFGIVLFLILYFIIMYVDISSPKKCVVMFVRALSAGCAGVMIAGAYLALALDGVAGNSRLDSVLTGYDLVVYPSALMYLDILRSMVMAPDIIGKGTLYYYDTVRNSSLAVYLPMFGLAGVIAYFSKKRYVKDRIKTLLTVCLVIALIPALNASFSLMNIQYYARWYYMPIMFMALVTAKMIEEKRMYHMRRGVFATTAIFVMLSLGVFLPVKGDDGELVFFELMENENMFYRDAAVTAVITLFLIFLYYVVKEREKRLRAMTVLCCISAVAMTLVMVFNGKTLISDFGMEKWKEQMLETKPKLPDDGFYRIETDDTATNYEMAWGIPTMHCFLSTVPAEIFEFYNGAAGWRRTVESNPSLEREGLRAIISARFFVWNSLINEEHEYSKGEGTYGYERVDEQNGFTIFENRNYIPPGFTFDSYIRVSDHDTLNKFDTDRLLVKAIILYDDDADRYGHLMSELTANEREAEITDTEFDELCAERRRYACTTFTEEESGFYAVTADLPKESLVFFPVPATPGFTVYLDGKETDIIKADYGMMAVDVPEGVHEIRAVFYPSRLKQGLIISAAGLMFAALFGLYCAFEAKRD